MAANLKEQNVWRGRIIRYGPFILCAGIVLFLSTGEASAVKTSRIIRPVLEFLFPQAGEAALQVLHGYIRKTAHLLEYGLLAMLGARAFKSSSKQFLKSHWSLYVLAAIFVVAVSDELFQSLDPTRTGSAYDVLIDLAGAVIGVVLFYFTTRTLDRRKGIQIPRDEESGN